MLRIANIASRNFGAAPLGQTLVDPRDKCLADCVTQFPGAVADEQNRNVCQAGCIQRYPVGSAPILTTPSASAPPSSWSYVQQPDGSYVLTTGGGAPSPASAPTSAAAPTPAVKAVAHPWGASPSALLPFQASAAPGDTVNILGMQVSQSALALAAVALGAFFLLGGKK